MTSDEIRRLNTVAGRAWDSLEGNGEQLSINAEMLREIAAQLAEANELKRKEIEWMHIRMCIEGSLPWPKNSCGVDSEGFVYKSEGGVVEVSR